MKKKLKTDPQHKHMDMLIDALIENGNSLSNDERWHHDMVAKICHLNSDINFELLENSFELPASIKLSRQNNLIECDETYTTIKKKV